MPGNQLVSSRIKALRSESPKTVNTINDPSDRMCQLSHLLIGDGIRSANHIISDLSEEGRYRTGLNIPGYLQKLGATNARIGKLVGLTETSQLESV